MAHDKVVKTHTYPSGWATMFGIDKAYSPNVDKEMFLKISAYSAPKIKYFSTDAKSLYNFESSKLQETIKIFFPKDNIQESISHEYGEDTSTVGNTLATGRETLYRGAAEGHKLASGGTTGALFEEPFSYIRPARRAFPINIPLVAFTDLNKDIYDILSFFRRRTYASKDTSLGLVTYPSVFKISGGMFDKLQGVVNGQNDGYFIITNVDIDYNPEVKFFSAGLPMQANLTLNLTELNLRFSEDFTNRPTKTSIKSSSSRGDVNNIIKDGKEIKAGTGDVALNKLLKPSTLVNVPNEESVKESQSILGNMLKKSQLGRTIGTIASNPTAYLSNIAKEEVNKVVKGSTLYQQIDMFTNVNPIHLLEVKEMLKKISG